MNPNPPTQAARNLACFVLNHCREWDGVSNAFGFDQRIDSLAREIDEKTRLPQLTVIALAAQGVVDAYRCSISLSGLSDQIEQLRDALAEIKTKS